MIMIVKLWVEDASFKKSNSTLIFINNNFTYILKCRIRHDNSGLGPGWHLKEVLIQSQIDGRQWLCECNQWLAKDEGDGKIERDLVAVEQNMVSMK